MRVCLFGMFDEDMSRNRLLIRWLRAADFHVDVCRVGAPPREARRALSVVGTAFRLVGAYATLAWRFARLDRPDVLVVAYPGHLVMPLAWFLGALRRVPIVFDIFISLYDTVVSDRKLASPTSLIGRTARLVDRVGCRLATRVLVDTPDHGAFIAELTKTNPDKFRTLWVGAEQDVFKPVGDIPNGRARVLFYGTFIPLHGLPTIVRAAEQLADDEIDIRVIGKGQLSGEIAQLCRSLEVENIEFVDWVPFEELADEIERAHLCLGIFGDSGKTRRVVPNKVYQCVAAGRPVLTGDTPAIRAAFEPDTEIAVCELADAAALADSIRALCADRARLTALAAAGRQRFEACYAESVLANLLRTHLDEVLKR